MPSVSPPRIKTVPTPGLKKIRSWPVKTFSPHRAETAQKVTILFYNAEPNIGSGMNREATPLNTMLYLITKITAEQ